MKLTCANTDSRGETCNKDATVALLTFDVDGWNVTAACDDCAPEVMHEMKCSGFTDDDMIRVTVDPPNRAHLAQHLLVRRARRVPAGRRPLRHPRRREGREQRRVLALRLPTARHQQLREDHEGVRAMPAITSKQINDVVAAQRAAKRRRIAGEMHRVHQAAQRAVEKDTQQPVEPDNIDLQALLALLAPYTMKP